MELRRRENEICEFPFLSGGYPITNIFLPGVLSESVECDWSGNLANSNAT